MMRDKPILVLIIGGLCAIVLAMAVMCPSSPAARGWHALLRWIGLDWPENGPIDKPAGDPGQHVTVTGSGSAVWVPDPSTILPDSVPISVWVDIGPGLDTATVVIGTDTIPVALDIEIDGPIYPFRVFGEAAFDGPQIMYGGGASWEPLRLWGASGGPGLCAGDGWFAPVARISRPIYSTLQAGAEAGWRFQRGPDELHFGVSFGFQI